MIKEKREKIHIEIVKMRKQGLTDTAIAKLYDITRQRVWQICNNDKKKAK